MMLQRSMPVILFILLVIIPARYALSDDEETYHAHDIIIGAKAGYSMFEGYYRSRFSGSYCTGLSLMYGNPGIAKYLMGELEVAYARYPLRKGRTSMVEYLSLVGQSRGSYMESISLNFGPVFYYPIDLHFQIYTGLSALGSYLHLHLDRYDKNEKTIKPGLLARAGFFIPVRKGFRFRIGAEYTLKYLSGKPLYGFNFIGGLSYNFNPVERAGEPGAERDAPGRIEWYMAMAEKAVKKGNAEEARENYKKVLAIDGTNREARRKLDEIKKAEADYARATRLAGNKRFYDALPLLEDAGAYLLAARNDIEEIRKQLAAEIPGLEKTGIELYEKGDYRGCITIMNRLLLVDPRNKVGLIYLPRAVKRQEAMERLR
ncbi:MAG: hypothetical protein JW807_06730 [Spirochaetes bacterium]|nr:hypothetical protein [Spirochaetota bacterium]